MKRDRKTTKAQLRGLRALIARDTGVPVTWIRVTVRRDALGHASLRLQSRVVRGVPTVSAPVGAAREHYTMTRAVRCYRGAGAR